MASLLFLAHHCHQNHYFHLNFNCIFSFSFYSHYFTLLIIHFLSLIIAQNCFKGFNFKQQEFINQFDFFRIQLIIVILLLFFWQLDIFLNRLQMGYERLELALDRIPINSHINYCINNHYFVNNCNSYIEDHFNNNCYYQLKKELFIQEINLLKNQEQSVLLF